MRVVLIVLISLCTSVVFAQYPNTGLKIRLGYQSTGDGLIYRGNGTPTYTPEVYDSAFAFIDTLSGVMYTYISGAWTQISGSGDSFDGHVDSLVFNTIAVVVDSVGKMYYDASNETISVGIDGGAVYQMGQELFYPLVVNKSGATITNGQLVMVDTATLTTGDHVRVILARNGTAYPSSYIMGVATTDIPNDSTGLVTFFGYVREVKHADIAQTGATLDVGDILYASATEPGRYTDTAPTSPAHKSTIALVVRKPSVNNMTLLVRPWLAPKLATLSDVMTTSVTGLSVLRYNSTTGNWEASATAGIVASDTAAMLSNYVTLGTSQTITGTKTVSALLHRISGFTQDSFRLDYAAWPVSASQRIPYTISKGSGYYPSTGAMSTFMSRWNWGAVSDYNNASAFVYMGTDASGTGTLSNAAIAEYWNQYSSKSLRIMANGRMAFGNFNPSYTLDLYGKTDGLRIPVGTYAQRPTGAAGVLRFNSDSTGLEYHNGTGWRGIVNTWDAGAGGGGGSSVWSTSADTVYLPSTKYVGIGTSNPDEKLEVVGTAKANQLKINTSGVDELSINNNAGVGSGGNFFIGNGGQSITTGFGNTGIGLNSLKSVTEGNTNLSVGANAMRDVTTGFLNVAIGGGVLTRLTTGRNNLAFGANIAFLSVNDFTGSYNLFLGGASGRAAETLSFSTFVGQSTGINLTDGSGNILVGFSAGGGTSSTSFSDNLGIGNFALSNQSGTFNVSIGTSAMRESSSASYNTAIGTEAGYYNTGNYNTVIGHQAGKTQVAGGNMTSLYGSLLLGYDARATNGESNTIVIGSQAKSQGSNTIMLGNSSISSLYCYDTSISSPSDERDKKDIEGLSIGIDFLKKLEPVAFTWNMRDGGKVGMKDVGFIAQQALPAQLDEPQGENLKLVEYKEEGDQYYMQYANLIPVLVKAIKEQQAQIDALKAEIETLKNK